MIGFVSNEGAPMWKGVAFSIAMFAASELRSFLINYYFFLMFRTGIKIQTTLTGAVYKKVHSNFWREVGFLVFCFFLLNVFHLIKRLDTEAIE